MHMTEGFCAARFITTSTIQILFSFMLIAHIHNDYLQHIIQNCFDFYCDRQLIFVCLNSIWYILVHINYYVLIMCNIFFIAYNNVKSYLQYVLLNRLYDQMWLHKRRTTDMLENRCGGVVTDFLPYPKFRKRLLSW